MSHEIVPMDPTDVFVDMDPIFAEEEYVWEPYDSEKLPETLASGIQRFLRVAILVESEEPRIAYLCRFYTFVVAHRIDSSSTGRGVRKFKYSILQRLGKDNELTMNRRKEGSDIKELKRVYDAYKEYIIRHGPAFNLDSSQQREKLVNAHRISSVLYEVLKAVDRSGADASAPLDIETAQLFDTLTLIEESHKRNLDGAFVHKITELIVDKCKPLEEERQIQMSQGETEIDAIYKEEVQIKKDKMFAYGSMEHDYRPSSAVPSLFGEDKYPETQEKLNKVEKKIEEMNLKLKDIDFWTKMMRNMFPDQVPPSTRANQTENNNNDKLSL